MYKAMKGKQIYTQLAPNLKCQGFHYWHCFSRPIEWGFGVLWRRIPTSFGIRRQRVSHSSLSLGFSHSYWFCTSNSLGGLPNHPGLSFAYILVSLSFPLRTADALLPLSLSLRLSLSPLQVLALFFPDSPLFCCAARVSYVLKKQTPGFGLTTRLLLWPTRASHSGANLLRHGWHFSVVPALMNRPPPTPALW